VVHDLLIVGAGPAGLSAGLVARGNGLDVHVLEAEREPGGQLRLADHPVVDVLGRPAVDGPALVAELAAHARAAGVPLTLGHPVRAISRMAEHFVVRGPGEVERHARVVLLATGTRRRSLGVPGEELRARRPPPAWLGQRVVVIGGGDEAVTTAIELARQGVEVTLVARAELRARPPFVRELSAEPRVEVLHHDTLVRFEAGRVLLGSGRERAAVHVLVRVGVEVVVPPLALEPLPARTTDGRLVVDADHQTTVPRLFAAGDCTVEGSARYAAVAIGHGAQVARFVEELLARGP
jgi:thioredoxin reductase